MIKIEKTNTKLANKLKRLRVQKDKTQKQLAEIFDVSVSAISSYEVGDRVPSDKIKAKYSLFFGKTVDDIFFK